MQHPYWYVGTLGIIAMEASYVPQIVRLWRRGQAHDLSVFFPGLNVLGRLLAVVYATLNHELVFGAGFLFGIFIRGSLLAQVVALKLRAREAERAEAAASVVPAADDSVPAFVGPTSSQEAA